MHWVSRSIGSRSESFGVPDGMCSPIEIVRANGARRNERDPSVALENGPLHLLEPLEANFVHRRKDVLGRDAFAIEVFLDDRTALHEDGGSRLHDPSEPPHAIAQG